MYKLNELEVSMVNGADGSCLKDPPSGSHDDWENGTKNVLTGIYDGLVDAAEYVMEKIVPIKGM